MKASLFSTDTINFLATLGWNAADFYGDSDLGQARPSLVKHPTVAGIIARRPSSRSKSQDDPSVFVLDYDGNQYPSRGLVIEGKTVETARPQWQKAVMLWYTRAVFTAQQIAIVKQDEQAQAEARRVRRDEALQALLPQVECTRSTIDDIESTGMVHLNDEGRPMGVSLRSYLEWRFPISADNQRRLQMIAEVTRAFRQAGFVRE